jgi:hypothetical protein
VYAFITALSRKKKTYIRWYTDEDARIFAEDNEINLSLEWKMHSSVVLQAVVDCHYKFRDVYSYTSGAAHDATEYHISPLSTLVHNSMLKHDRVINGKTISLYILGVPAYPLSDRMMKGYIGMNLPPNDASFNVYQAHVCVLRLPL